MRYFKEIALWKIILLNIVVGALMSGPFMLGIIALVGIFTPPTVESKIAGILIFLFIIIVIVSSNYLLWKYGKKKYSGNTENEGKSRNITLLKLILIVTLLIITLASFFVFPNVWSRFNSWWF